MLNVESVLKQLADEQERGENIKCPFCGHKHSISDPDICSSVVTYWGEDLHDLSCGSCGKDFIVKECVKREFYSYKDSGACNDPS